MREGHGQHTLIQIEKQNNQFVSLSSCACGRDHDSKL